MSGKSTNLFRVFFAFADLVVFNIVHLILLSMMTSLRPDNEYNYTVLVIFSNIAWLISAYATGLYIDSKMFDVKRIITRTSCSVGLLFMGELTFIYFYQYNFSRLFVQLNLACFASFLLLSRLGYMAAMVLINSGERFKKKIVIIGCNDLSKELIRQLETNQTPYLIKGFFDDAYCDSNVYDYPFIGKISDCVNYSIKNQISEIYSTISPAENTWLYKLSDEAESQCIRFKFVPDLRVFINRNTHLDFINHMPILSLRSEPLENVIHQIKKRMFDIVFSSLIIVFFLSWLLPILAILIKLDSKGPVFFKQLRSGKNNRPFLCLKLRSLNTNKLAHSQQVTRDDARFTQLGRFLRKSNLDELPQFFNVLMGQMSVVGSRPHMLKHTEDYSKMYNRYMLRHLIKPGVTGWAQINGHRGEIKAEEQLINRVEHDIWYMENWNVWLDIHIVLHTLKSTIVGDKNAF